MKNKEFLSGSLIAHRGIYDNKGVYENTLKSIEKAIEKNYTVEIDVRMLLDGTIIVFHDQDMERLLHLEGDIEKLSHDELTYITKYPIPTLAEMLELVAGRVPLIIELKTRKKRGMFESKVAEILDDYKGLYAIQSFNISTLRWFYKNRPNVILGYLVNKKNLSKMRFFKRYDFINIKMDIINDKRLKFLRANYLVLGYTVRSKEELEIKQNYYDNLICDNLLEIDAS